MKITEVIVSFPKAKKRSNVIGKLPSGHLIYSDITTGLPYVINAHKAAFDMEPGSNELPARYNEDPPAEMWMVVDNNGITAYSVHFSEREARLAAEKMRRWQHKNVKVIQT